MILEKNEMKLLMLLSGSEQYLLNDQFTTDRAAGAVDGTPAEPGPGTRTVVDTENKLSITGGNVSISGGKATPAWGDPAIRYGGISREAGRIFVFKQTQISGSNVVVSLHLDTTISTLSNTEHGFANNPTTAVRPYETGTVRFTETITGSIAYHYMVVVRGTGAYFFIKGGSEFTNWTLLWASSVGSTSTLYPLMMSHDMAVTDDFIRVPEKLWLPSPLLSDSFGSVPTVVDSGGNGLDGTATKVGFGGPPPGKATDGGQAWFDGSKAFINVYSAGLNSALDPSECGIIARVKPDGPGFWTDGGFRYVTLLYVDASNYIAMRKSTLDGQWNNGYIAGGVGKWLTTAGHSFLDWTTWGLRISESADEFEQYLDGSPLGATLTGLGVWAGSLDAARPHITSDDSTPSNPWHGWLGDYIITLNSVVPTDADHLAIHTALAAGTLTTAALDGYFGSGNWLWWKLDDATFVTAEDSGTNGLDGTYTDVQIKDRRGFFDRDAGSFVNLYSSNFNTFFNGAEGVAVVRGQVADSPHWSDALNNHFFRIQVDSDNFVMARLAQTANQLEWFYKAGGTQEYTAKSSVTVLDRITVGLTWSKVADEAKMFYNGIKEGGTHTGLGTWAGDLVSTLTNIGTGSPQGTSSFAGWLGDFIVSKVVTSEANMAAIHNKLEAGELTNEDLNGYFGAGNWAWWKIDEQSLSDGLGHQEGIAGGRGAGGAGLPWLNRTNHADAAGKWKNAPVAGAEELTDGALEVWASATDLTNWTEVIGGTSTVNRDGVEQRSGTYCARFDVDASNTYTAIKQAITCLAGDWVLFKAWAKLATDGSLKMVIGGSVATAAFNPTTSYTQKAAVLRSPSVDPFAEFARASLVSKTAYWDDVEVFVLSLIDLLALRVYSSQDVLIDADLVVYADTQAGVALNWDDPEAPNNGVIAYHDGTNAKLEKCVAGVWTSVISAAATYSANAKIRVIKDGTSYSLYYNGAQVGSTSTISDAGVINNKYHGTFNTYISNTIDDVIVRPRGSSNEYGYLDRYV